MRRRILLRLMLCVGLLLPAVAVYSVLAQGEHIRYGDTVSGTISNPGDDESWLFDGRAGDVITIRVARTGGDLIPLISLEDANSTVLIDLDWAEAGPADVLVTASLHAAGTYTITVRGDSSTIGSYTLTLALEKCRRNRRQRCNLLWASCSGQYYE